MQGSAFYLSGAGLVIIGWTIIGLCLEAYGFWLLFCEFIPVVLQYSRRIPFMSKVLDVPGLKAVSGAAYVLHIISRCVMTDEHHVNHCSGSGSTGTNRCEPKQNVVSFSFSVKNSTR
jgi:hypothetical protein